MSLALAAPPVEAVAQEAISATQPAEVRGRGRDDVRLMVAGPEEFSHRSFAELPDVLAPSDLLVVNVSATRAAALTTLEGLRVHISTDAPGGYQVIEVRLPAGAASRPLDEEPPAVLHLAGGGQVEILAPYPDGQGRLWLARLAITESLDTYLVEHGQPIRYPYIAEAWPIEAYQTVFGRLPGSAEMPSAARPFTPDIVTRIVAEGVAVAPLLLHTGVSSLESGEPPYPERYSVPEATAEQVNLHRRLRGRVIAVGTTVVRALESVTSANGKTHPGRGWTDLIITPQRGVHAVDGILTGWHEAESSHLAMLQAVGGKSLVDESYEAALAGGYLWHEFGDTHLLLAPRP